MHHFPLAHRHRKHKPGTAEAMAATSAVAQRDAAAVAGAGSGPTFSEADVPLGRAPGGSTIATPDAPVAELHHLRYVHHTRHAGLFRKKHYHSYEFDHPHWERLETIPLGGATIPAALEGTSSSTTRPAAPIPPPRDSAVVASAPSESVVTPTETTTTTTTTTVEPEPAHPSFHRHASYDRRASVERHVSVTDDQPRTYVNEPRRTSSTPTAPLPPPAALRIPSATSTSRSVRSLRIDEPDVTARYRDIDVDRELELARARMMADEARANRAAGAGGHRHRTMSGPVEDPLEYSADRTRVPHPDAEPAENWVPMHYRDEHVAARGESSGMGLRDVSPTRAGVGAPGRLDDPRQWRAASPRMVERV
ncbi:hypothetical protein AMAG_09946 [Allomyces macrogynus ATCC 38327]|uniref:Uncharacterized protein n=1 Tax=Allomyces macrogynus (strain ATCC 38327) TaxID=578462 RepID=A0A0L0SQE0_ALLM3|nr:hypothetical protein AMAG_09946 [Allomyces macrogynus ATCC 38327]|eukprot:KNE64589.1 hypothetical protein AMAG_09946 [Allomyces macrogynus ATCC 38327]